jgi:hypothetical protein
VEIGLAVCCSELSNIEYDTSNGIGSDASRIGSDSQTAHVLDRGSDNSLCFPSIQFSLSQVRVMQSFVSVRRASSGFTRRLGILDKVDR